MPFKRIYYLTLIFWLCINFSFAQSIPDSCYKSFFKTYVSSGNLEMKKVCRTSDGGYILGGYNGPLYYAAISKLNKAGTVEWSKYLTDQLWVRNILQTDDGNVLVSSISYNTHLTKFSNNGTVLWSRKFTNLSGYDLKLADIQKTNDGGFVMILNSAWGSGPMYNYIVRLNGMGDIIWRKEILHNPLQPILKSLFVENDAVFVAADFYTNAFKSELDIMRLDLATGAIVWKNKLSISNNVLFEPHLTKINDSIALSAFHIELVPSTGYYIHKAVVVILNANSGAKLSSFRFENPELTGTTPYYGTEATGAFQFCKTTDNNLFFSQLAFYNGDTVLNVSKFTTSGNAIWSRNYKNYKHHDVWTVKNDKDQMLICGRRFTTYPNLTDASFLMKIDHEGNTSPSTLPPTADCYNEPIVPVIQPFAITETPSNFTSVVDYSSITDSVSTMLTTPLDVMGIESCALIDSSCNTLSVTGPDSVCQSNGLYTYIAHRSAGCNNLISWTCDSLMIHVVASTDSSITVRFLKTDSTTIEARLVNSCSDIIIKKTVYNNRNADSLNIGPNKSFCFPGNVLINAGKGFKNYMWNTGSSDSAVIVSAPGTYYADVIDFCGNHSSDTITITNAPVVSINIGIDRNKCNNDTVHLAAPVGFMNYTWGPNYNISSQVTQQVVVNPSVDTMYFVKAEKTPGCFGYDTVRVTVHVSLPINLGPGKNICRGDSALLDAGVGFSQYLWNTGTSLQQLIVYNTGDYTITATSSVGCNSYDTIHVNAWPLPSVHLDKDSTLCKGSSRVLQAGSFISYLWQDGSILPSLTVSGTGKYFVTVTDVNACKGSDTVNITTLLSQPIAFLPSDTAICNYGAIVLKPLSDFTDYLWNTGSKSPSITVSQQGIYWLQVKDSHQCTGIDSIVVKPKDCIKGLLVPNAFTPDNNGRNDNFKPFLGGVVKQYQFTIYNRYGQIVFNTQTINYGWDGTFGGVKQNAGTFIWVCSYQLEGEPLKKEKGTFLLLR